MCVGVNVLRCEHNCEFNNGLRLYAPARAHLPDLAMKHDLVTRQDSQVHAVHKCTVAQVTGQASWLTTGIVLRKTRLLTR
jgi:hypothetical protein